MKLRINPKVKINKIYNEEFDFNVFVLDDVLENPEEVINFAKQYAYFQEPGQDGTLYPGMRDLMPAPYNRFLETVIKAVGLCEHANVHRCLLSLVTLTESEITHLHTLPHVDSIHSDDFACVHYFCNGEQGGTSLYKYRPNQLAKVTHDNLDKMNEMVEQSKKEHEHYQYLTSENPQFETLITISAKFNRLVIYPSNQLHCANLSQRSISKDPSSGRLTVASFFEILT